MNNEQAKMIAGSILVAGGAIAYSIAAPRSEKIVVGIIVMFLGVPLLFPGLWGSLKSQVNALWNKK